MAYEDKYRKSTMKSKELMTELPVAIKNSTAESNSEWVKVMVEEVVEPELDLENITTLRDREKMEWMNVLYKVLSLGDNPWWRILVIILILVNYFLVSYVCIFTRDINNMEVSYSIIACDTIYSIDYALAVTIYFWKNLQLRLVSPPRSKRTLIFETFLVIPYSSFYGLAYHKSNSTMFIILRFVAFLRLNHLVQFFKEKSNSAGANHWMYFIIQYSIYFFVFQHALACCFFILACPIGCKKPGGWADKLEGSARYPSSTFEWYLTCMYFAAINFTNSGFGDLVATSSLERIVTILAMIIGLTLTIGVFIGSLTSQFVNSSYRKATFRNQLDSIKEHCIAIKLDKYKIRNISNYYSILWTKKSGIREAEDLNLLPQPLRMEICFDINFALLRCSLIFRDKPEAFLRTVSLKMKHEFYQPGEVVYYQHVVKYKMVCIASGVVEVLSDEDNESPIISFTAGSVIGEAAMVLSLPARATMKAACYTEIQALYKQDYLTVNTAFPEYCADIRVKIFSRINSAEISASSRITHKDIETLSLYVSHNRQLSEIKKLKNRLDPKTAYTFGSYDKFYRECLPLYRLSKNIPKKKTTHLCLSAGFPWIMQPDTTLTWTWEVIIVVNTFLIGILYPYYIAFHRVFPRWLGMLSVLLETINFLDIYITLTTAIREKDKKVQTFKEILNKRMSTYSFHLDVFSAFYFESFSYLMKDRNRWYYLLKYNKMLKMYKVVQFLRHLEESLTAQLVAIRLIKYAIYLTMCPYWFGTILYLETCFNNVCDETGWFNTKLLAGISESHTNPCIAHISYTSLYYALTCLSSLGYGDILPGNLKDSIIVCFGSITGIFVFGYCIAEFSATFTHSLKQKTDFQETLFCIHKFMDEKRMKNIIRKRIHNFFVLQWYNNKGIGLTNKKSLLYNAPWKINQDILVKERLEAIITVPLFAETNVDFLQLIAIGSRVIILPPNEVVVYSGGVSREMYIIQKGYCSQEKGNKKINLIGRLEHFGMTSLLYEQRCLYTVRTITHVKLICIDFNSFTRAISMFPAVGEELQDVMKETQIKTEMEKLKTVRETGMSLSRLKRSRLLGKEMKGSFINVYRYCSKRKENYNNPFNELGNLFWLRYLLFPVCILPGGMFLKIWVIFRLLVACIVCLITPIQFLYAPHFPVLDKVAFSLDFIAYIDLYLLLHVGYYGDKKQLIIHPYKTSGHYLKRLFVLDLILCFPWEHLVLWMVPEHNEYHTIYSHMLNPHTVHCLFRTPRIFQIYRLPMAFDYLEGNITRKGDIVQIIKFVPTTIMLINIWASIITITSCTYYSRLDSKIAFSSHSQFFMLCQKHSWIDKSRYQNYSDAADVYMTAIYFVTGTLVGCGFGDITAQSKTHLIISLFMIVFGVLFFGYIFASISSHKANLHTTLSHYQEMLSELSCFMEYENVNSHMQKRITDYYEFRWKRNSGAEINDILTNVHNALLEDAVLFMYEVTLREIPLFENVERSFFRVLGRELREQYYTSDFTIIRSDDVMQNMFIIYRGKVEVVSKYNEMQTYMGIGGMFGNIRPQAKTKSKITIKTTRNVDTLYIETERFYSILNRYPSIMKKMESVLQNADDYIMPTSINTTSEDSITMGSTHSLKLEEISFTSTAATTNRSISTTGTGGASILRARAIAAIFLPNKWFRVAIAPDAPIFRVYSYVVVFAVYVNCLLATFEFAFQLHEAFTISFVILLDVIFIVKMFLEMHRAYIDRYGEYVVENSKILRLYFKNKKTRIIDFLANMPIYYLAFFLKLSGNQNDFLIFSLLRLITLLRCYYIVEFYKSHTNKLLINALNLKIAVIAVLISLIVHCLACVWYLYACPLFFCWKNSWLTRVPGSDKMSKINIYILCYYKIINVLTTTGTGDILPNSRLEMIYLIVIMITTKFFIGIFIGDVTSVVNSYSSSLVNYEYGIAELKDYLQNGNVSEHQMEKMWHYVRQLWTRSRGKQMPRLIKSLPYVMHYDLLNEIYGSHLRNSYIFSNTEEPFIRQLAVRVNHVVFFPGNYIVQHGNSDQRMYFIHRGEVDILTVHSNLTETIHDVLHAGEMFGIAQGLFYGVPHHFSFRAKTTVDIISLHLRQLQELLEFFPTTKKVIYTKVEMIYGIH